MSHEGSCRISEREITILREGLTSMSERIEESFAQMADSKEKYLPTISVVYDLKEKVEKLDDDLHHVTVGIADRHATLGASTDSAHLRLNEFNDDFKDLMKLPKEMRSERLWFVGIIVTIAISFTAWTESKLSTLQLNMGNKYEKISENMDTKFDKINDSMTSIKIEIVKIHNSSKEKL